MAEIIRVLCDVCGAPIVADRTRLDVVSGPLVRRGVDHLDVCPACLPRLTEALDRPQATPESPLAPTVR